MKIEVCIDNIESLHTAIAAGADRIELCSALALGGLTPSLGLITQAVAVSSIPIYVMIRPRDGDFVFSDEEIHFMEHEIHTYKQLGVNGVVIGALNPDATINEDALRRWTTAAQGVGVTFHRAFDLVANPLESLELLCHYSIERILTSGLQPTAPEGKAMIKYLVETAQNRLSIMAGAGVNDNNALSLANIGVTELHLSGKGQRISNMLHQHSQISMGTESCDDWVSITDYDKVKKIVRLF
ncbi:copper homeostasis protein CutC [Vibrio litoralis]|uniref:copper homeostasis protein CutC n=1 Tax=Vibrio litoralis TaxID=335972 RepID=UPI000413B5B0|nr:copper homeostasis protein CutC [Vibrio litoralis]